MNQSHFSNEILALPIYKGRFDANKLTTDKVDIYFASYHPQGTEIDLHKHDTDNHGVVTQGQLILIVDNQEKIFDTGDWYYLPPNCVHAARFQQETSIIEFWFKK